MLSLFHTTKYETPSHPTGEPSTQSPSPNHDPNHTPHQNPKSPKTTHPRPSPKSRITVTSAVSAKAHHPLNPSPHQNPKSHQNPTNRQLTYRRALFAPTPEVSSTLGAKRQPSERYTAPTPDQPLRPFTVRIHSEQKSSFDSTRSTVNARSTRYVALPALGRIRSALLAVITVDLQPKVRT